LFDSDSFQIPRTGGHYKNQRPTPHWISPPPRELICFEDMAQVHGGFLDAYDSVRHRLLTLVEALLGTLRDDAGNEISSWHVYLTGHSLGGALATLFAVELSSKLAKSGGQTQITMYNFGSPRVGNKQFADMYNEVGEIFLDFFPVLYHLNYTTFLKHSA
jgi:hypothetical protein